MQDTAKQATLLPDENLLVQLIVFRSGDEEFGLPIDCVREIIKKALITPIPNSPKFVKGIVNVRGEIVTTIDIKKRFSIPEDSSSEPKHIIVTRQDDTSYGLLVDEVIEVLRVPKKEISPPPNLVTSVQQKNITAIISHENRLIILLDLKKIVSHKDILALSSEIKKKSKPKQKGLS